VIDRAARVVRTVRIFDRQTDLGDRRRRHPGVGAVATTESFAP
jgi:hypothetical protein